MTEYFRNKTKGIQIKLFIFFLASFFVLVLSLIYVTGRSKQQVFSLYDNRINDEKSVINSRMGDLTRLSKALSADYSQWDDAVSYLKGRMPNFPANNLNEATLDTFESSAMWIFRNDGKLVYKINNSESDEGIIDFTPYQAGINSILAKDHYINFSVQTKTGIMEIFGYTIVKTDDPQHLGSSSGYLLVGKLIIDETLIPLTNADFQQVMMLLPNQINDYPKSYPQQKGQLIVTKDYKDITGKTIVTLYVNVKDDSLPMIYRSGIEILIITLATYASLFIGVLLVVWIWIVRPINKIYKSLEHQDVKHLKSLVKKDNEFGQIARLIADFFGQENQLEKDMNDNTRLLEELSANKSEIEHTNNVMLGRELKMIDLKKEIDELRAELSHKKGKKDDK